MRFSIRHLFALLSFAALGAVTLPADPARANGEEAKPPVRVIGTLEAELDYRLRTWYLTARGDESRSGFTGMGESNNVVLFGNAEPDRYANVKDSLRVEFEVMRIDGELTPSNVEIRYTPTDLSSPYTAQRESSTWLRVDHVEAIGDQLRITGTFSSELEFVPGLTGLIGGDISPTGGAGLIAGALTEGKRRTRDLKDGKFIALVPRR
ncbi:MAG: hypothetical protein AAF371_03335 [Pseudomonadota bacterium]